MLSLIRNEPEALALIREHPVITVTPCGELPSIVKAVVGGSVKGSWWGHPKGQLIFRIWSALGEHEEVLTVKLVEGKITFIHHALWPVLLRIVTDAGWQKSVETSLGREARRLLRQVEKEGKLHMDPILERAATAPARAALRRGKQELEKSLRVLSTSEHTEKGKHQSVLIWWEHWSKQARAKIADCSFEDALARLEKACLGRRTAFSK
jgi:hypothetical protein